ncbi:MAG: hypothetical protein WCP20_05905 [Desulfuromonadales bacterium]
MAIKLGELLLKEKLITPDQLDEALKSQTLFGIKLGSSLIELGFITDEQLCGLLSRTLGVPAASPRALSSIPPEVLALVSVDMAGKHRVVPISVDGKKLALAMADPSDFNAIDEVAFATGYIVHPYIVPDVRITSALSKYYRIAGDFRYLRIEGELAGKRRKAPATASVNQDQRTENPMMSNSGELLNIGIPFEFEGFANLPGFYDDHAIVMGGVERYSVDRLSTDFASAKNRDQVANVFITYLGQEFTIGALFIIRNNMVIGWRGIASGKRIEELESLIMHLSKPSVIQDVFETGQFFMGTLAQTPENMQLMKVLRVASDTPLLVLPVVMLNKIVAVVIVSAEMEALGKRLSELQKLVYKASLAFEMLIIKNKILTT